MNSRSLPSARPCHPATALVALCLALVASAGCSRGAGETPAAEGSPAAPGEDVSAVRSFERAFPSSGREIPMRVILPAGAGEHPMVILLHGRSGLPFYGDRLEALGLRLAESGIGAAIPDYFATTGDEPPPEVTDARFRAWRWALADAVESVGGLAHVDRGRIGVAGFSLGGFVAVTEAAGNPRIRAVAANYTGASPYFPDEPERFPPLLVIHAAGDPVVPVTEAEALIRRARELGGRVEAAIFPAETHVLEGEAWDLAAGRMVSFFRRSLTAPSGWDQGGAESR